LKIMEIERRNNERVPVSFEAKIGGGYQGYRARVTDLSLGGCYVETMTLVGINELLTIEVRMPTGNWLKLKGQVIYCHAHIGFGIRFFQLTQLEIDVVRNLIEYTQNTNN